MSVEQVKLMELIMYYKFRLTLGMQNTIAQIIDKATLKEIDSHIRQNHNSLTQIQLVDYLKDRLNDLYKRKQIELIDLLKNILGNKKDEIIALVNPLKNTIQQDEFMNYLKNNYHNKDLMRIDRLLKKSLEISKKYI